MGFSIAARSGAAVYAGKQQQNRKIRCIHLTKRAVLRSSMGEDCLCNELPTLPTPAAAMLEIFPAGHAHF